MKGQGSGAGHCHLPLPCPALPSKLRGCTWVRRCRCCYKEAKTRPCQPDHITRSLLVAFSVGVHSSGGKGTVW